MGGRYGKYGEIKRLARLRQHTMSLPFRVRGGKAALERQPHGKKDIHAGKARKKRYPLSVADADKGRGAWW